MKPERLGLAAVAASLLAVVAMSASAEPVLRSVEDPMPAGLEVSASALVWEGNVLSSMHLVIGNDSTNVLTIDLARSSFVPPDGEPHPLTTYVSADFAATLLPGEGTSDEIDLLEAFEIGDQLKLYLVWTLGADVDSAVWVWGVAAPVAEPAPQKTSAAPAKTAQAPTANPPQPAADGGAVSDFLIGLAVVAVGLVVLGVLVWILWA